MDIQRRFHTTLAAYPARKAVFFMAAVVVALHLALSLFAWALAQHEIVPVLEQKAYATGLAEARKLSRRLTAGVALEKMEGVQQQFDATLRRNPDLAYIILTDSVGRILVRSGSGGEVFTPERYSAVTREVERKLVTYGMVHVGIDRQFIVTQMKRVQVDAAVVLAASLLLALGLAWYAASQVYARPVGHLAQVLGRMAAGDYRFRAEGVTRALEQSLNAVLERVNRAFAELVTLAASQGAGVRAQAAYDRLRTSHQFADGTASVAASAIDRATPGLLAFLCLLVDSLSRPALAHYGADLVAFRTAVPAPLRAGLPGAALYLGIALTLPLARSWMARAGGRNCYLAGCMVLMLGCGSAALVDDFVTLVVARSVCGMAMALALVAVLDDIAPGDRRTGASAVGTLLTALAAAEVVGTALGGIAVEHGSVRVMFAVAALVALMAALTARALMSDRAPVSGRRLLASSAGLAGRPAYRRPVMMLALSAQLPAAAAWGAFPAVILPLVLQRTGFDSAAIGRQSMLIAALLLAAAPLFIRLAFRSRRFALLAVAGVALIGVGIDRIAQGNWLALLALASGQLLMFGTMLVLAQRALRAAEFRDGALPHWPWSAPLAAFSAALGALLGAAGVHGYGAAIAAAAAGGAALIAGALFLLIYLAVGYNQANLTSCPPR
jgi:MFS family permease